MSGALTRAARCAAVAEGRNHEVMADWCKHDIDVSVSRCGSCTPPAQDPDAPPRLPGMTGPWFPARHPGHCDQCDEGIAEGDLIRADGEGGWQCESCAPEPAPPPGKRPALW